MMITTGLITFAALTFARPDAIYKNGAVGGVTLPMQIFATRIAHI